ncbi:MAG: glycosyltransferase family 39 protein [Chloroflexi bacterium]|nr:glycosyltransferase family 39 protein [Chloroflexota bacterium]
MKIASSWLSPSKGEATTEGIEAGELIPLVLVVGVALAARLVLLDRVPSNVMPDEADNMVDVYHVLAGTGPGLIGFDWTQLPALNVHLMAAFVRLFGLSVVGMRMAVVATSTLALFPFYLLSRRVVRPLPALLATLLLATGLWYLNFSRTAWSNIHVVLFGLWTLWLLLEALDRQKWYLYVLAGVGLGLTLYGYYSGRAMVVAILLFLPIGLLLHRHHWRSTLAGYLLMGGVATLLFLPQGIQILANWDYSNIRVDSVSIFHQRQPYLGETDPVRLLVLQAERVARGFLLLDGEMFHTPRYTPEGQPPLDYATGALYVAGLFLGLAALRATLTWYLLLAVPLFLTQLLSIGTPDTGRAVVVVPVFYLFVAVTLQSLVGAARSRRLLPVLVVLVVALAVHNLWWYFDWAQRPETAQARQPAVEYSEFGRWQQLQMERAARGERGFTVTDWHKMRTSLP